MAKNASKAKDPKSAKQAISAEKNNILKITDLSVPKGKMKALLLDVSYADKADRSVIRLYVTENKRRFWIEDDDFFPYLYALVDLKQKEKMIQNLIEHTFSQEEKFKAIKVEDQKKEVNGKAMLKMSFAKVSHLIQARNLLPEMGIDKREYDIPFAKRYLLDKRLEPCNWIEMDIVGEEIAEVIEGKEEGTDNESASEEEEMESDASQKIEDDKLANEEEEKKEKQRVFIAKNIHNANGPFSVEMISFDLETHVGKKFTIGIEPILMVSAVREKSGRVISYDTKEVKGLELVESEKELVEEIHKELNDADIVITYNGDNFDFPYTKMRAKKLGTRFLVNGKDIRIQRHGLDNAAKLFGVQHVDAFQVMRFLQRTGSVNTVKLDIESVSENVFGVYKEKVFPWEINEAHESRDEEKLERLVDYNLKDSETAYRIAKEFLPLFIEISKLTSQTLFDSTRNSTSSMVEDLLLKEAHTKGLIAPNKPKELEIRERLLNPIKGAFVKEPVAGLHEKIAVLDFASLYPSIIISHNISPETLNCVHPECKKNVSPDGTWFCTKEKGLFPDIVEKMLKQRLVLKAEYKKKKKEGIEDKVFFAKQWALKIVLNSMYGYLGYGRARWYSRDSASAVTSWARGYIQDTIAKAEEAEFKVLYGDTDSLFLMMGTKTKDDVGTFAEKVNKDLPEDMELEVDGFYKRGIFVTKKEGGAAKKKYALIDEKGALKIVGFEYVRRDWCNVAKDTQKKVIEMVLSEGDPMKAVKFVRKVLDELKTGKVPKKDLVIMTLLQRKPKDYDSIGPHVAAAMKAIERGKDLGVGSMLSFIITKNGKSISDRAELEEYVEEGNYDPDYYIENQVLPAVIKIVQELGYTKEDLLHGGKQSGLTQWF
ncbi:MAG: DNA-directed DNA polymerase [archaeon]